MTRPTFTCRNTLQRLREGHDQHKGEQEPKTMKTVRVEYTVILTGEDGKTVSVKQGTNSM